MGYKNAKCVLPEALLNEIQKYIDGEYIYIPRKENNRKKWGEIKQHQQQKLLRNQAIYLHYQSGVSVNELAGSYYLSPKTIYNILAEMNQQV